MGSFEIDTQYLTTFGTDAGKIDEATADEWLSTWIDEIGYYVPYRTISEYR